MSKLKILGICARIRAREAKEGLVAELFHGQQGDDAQAILWRETVKAIKAHALLTFAPLAGQQAASMANLRRKLGAQ